MATGSETAQSATDEDASLERGSGRAPAASAAEGTATQDPPDDGSADEFGPLYSTHPMRERIGIAPVNKTAESDVNPGATGRDRGGVGIIGDAGKRLGRREQRQPPAARGRNRAPRVHEL